MPNHKCGFSPLTSYYARSGNVVANVLSLSAKGLLEAEIAKLREKKRFRHVGRESRADQLLHVLKNPRIVEDIKIDMKLIHIPFRRLDRTR